MSKNSPFWTPPQTRDTPILGSSLPLYCIEMDHFTLEARPAFFGVFDPPFLTPKTRKKGHFCTFFIIQKTHFSNFHKFSPFFGVFRTFFV